MKIRAFHRRKKQWAFAVMSRDGSYARLDPRANESLDDFDIYEVEEELGGFRVIRKIPGIQKHYS